MIKRKIFRLFMCVAVLISMIGCQEEAVQEIVLEPQEQVEQEVSKDMVCVHVCGAVEQSGVYELEAGSRVADAVDAAGGLSKDASQESLNLARILADGEQIYVLTQDEMKEDLQNVARKTDGVVNINTSDKEELMTLKGIGETRAEAIIAYRKEHGNFQKIEDLCLVDGIGESTYEQIKDKITVN